jgi:hypothetical protein
MIFVGLEPRSKAYRAYDPATTHVTVTRDVIFDEEACWQWGEDAPSAAPDFTEFMIEEYSTTHPAAGDNTASHSSTPMPRASTPAASPACTTAPAAVSAILEASALPVTPADASPMFATPLHDVEEMLDADHDDDAPLRFRKVHSLIDTGAATPGPIERELLLLAAADEPTSLAEA